jgi:hypothetical protein
MVYAAGCILAMKRSTLRHFLPLFTYACVVLLCVSATAHAGCPNQCSGNTCFFGKLESAATGFGKGQYTVSSTDPPPSSFVTNTERKKKRRKTLLKMSTAECADRTQGFCSSYEGRAFSLLNPLCLIV